MSDLRHRRLARALGMGLAAVLLAACTGGGKGDAPPGTSATATGATASGSAARPDIVFVLTDDLSRNLVQYMPQVQRLQKNGTTFSDYFVTDSLCCPSRSSILTGDYPHNTGVFTNNGDDGGHTAFNRNGDEKKCYAPALQKAGYRTGFTGKYLRGYQPTADNNTGKPYVPPGWDEWDAAGNGYPEFNYDFNENGKTVHYGHDPKDYLTDVVAGKARSFIDSAAADHKPFMTPPRRTVTRTRLPTTIDLDVLDPADLPAVPELSAITMTELQQGVAMAKDAATRAARMEKLGAAVADFESAPGQ